MPSNTDRLKMAENWLQMFTPNQVAILAGYFSTYFDAVGRVEAARATSGGLPAILKPLDPEYFDNVESNVELQHGISAYVLWMYKTGRTANFYSAMLQETFGINSEYADKLGEEINTSDAWTGWRENLAGVSSYISQVFTAAENETDATGDDVFWELRQLGSKVRDMLERMNAMIVGRLLSSGAASKLATGDPTDASLELERAAIGLSGDVLSDAEIGGAWGKFRKRIKKLRLPKLLKTAAALGASVVPGGSAALKVVGDVVVNE